ncbi:MAG: hypothetical protein IJX71_02455, partial [Oscillospiraceae bacterium]|nr:hypothetical protein [Oscillospiraceae bacterium]
MDGCLQEESCTLVEEHLRECPDCARLLQAEQQVMEPVAAAEADKTEEEEVRRSVRKVKKRISVLSVKSAAVILLSLLLLWMGVNEARGMGVCFTNLDELVTAQLFVADLKAGN